MKTQAHPTQYFEIESMTSSIQSYSNSMLNSLERKRDRKKTFNPKQSFVKLLPTHWFDGVWDDLNVEL